jgi:hypothetical protein
MLRDNPLPVSVRLLLFATAIAVYGAHPSLGWAALQVISVYVTARIFRRAEQRPRITSSTTTWDDWVL